MAERVQQNQKQQQQEQLRQQRSDIQGRFVCSIVHVDGHRQTSANVSVIRTGSFIIMTLTGMLPVVPVRCRLDLRKTNSDRSTSTCAYVRIRPHDPWASIKDQARSASERTRGTAPHMRPCDSRKAAGNAAANSSNSSTRTSKGTFLCSIARVSDRALANNCARFTGCGASTWR
jgi:hypothetical protein